MSIVLRIKAFRGTIAQIEDGHGRKNNNDSISGIFQAFNLWEERKMEDEWKLNQNDPKIIYKATWNY